METGTRRERSVRPQGTGTSDDRTEPRPRPGDRLVETRTDEGNGDHWRGVTPALLGSFRPPVVDRPPIDRRLRLGDHSITLVTGPAGYGKTTLLAQWYRTLRRAGTRPAWLCIEAETVRPQDIERLLHIDLCQLHQGRLDDGIQSSLAAVADRDRVLFVDDVHHLDQRVVDHLLQVLSTPEGRPWRLVLAGRTSIQVLPRAPSQQLIATFGPCDLRLDDGVIDRVLCDASPDLAPWQRAELVERIDGWPAGLDLVGRVLETEGPPPGKLGELVDGHPIVADYFLREVFGGLPVSDQSFLIRSSVVACPSADVCDQLDGVSGSADRLARLGSSNAFVHSGSAGHDLRWVPMGRAFLLDRLRILGPEHEQEARRRVFHWLLAHRRYDEAVGQAAEIDDWYAVVDLVLDTGFDIISCGRAGHLVSWLDRVPAEVVMAEPGVAVLAAMALWVKDGDLAGADIDRWLARAASTRRGRPPCRAESLSAAIDAGRAAFGRLGPRTRKLLAERALRAEAALTPWAALAQAAFGLASYLDDEPREARRALTESLRIQSALDVEPRRCVTRLFSPTALGILALIELESGDYDNRADALISVAELQSPRSAGSTPGAGIIGLARSRAALAAGDYEGALELALQTATTTQLVAFRALGYLDAASIHCEQGRADRSADCLAKADELLAGQADVGRLVAKRRRAIERQVKLGRAARWSSVDLLTEREAEVLRLLDSDLSRREIAQELYLSFETVKTYVQRLYQKLGVSSRAAAVATAQAWGWMDQIDHPAAIEGQP